MGFLQSLGGLGSECVNSEDPSSFSIAVLMSMLLSYSFAKPVGLLHSLQLSL